MAGTGRSFTAQLCSADLQQAVHSLNRFAASDQSSEACRWRFKYFIFTVTVLASTQIYSTNFTDHCSRQKKVAIQIAIFNTYQSLSLRRFASFIVRIYTPNVTTGQMCKSKQRINNECWR